MCPKRDSNPHCMVFETIAYCQLGYWGRNMQFLRSPVNGRLKAYRTSYRPPQPPSPQVGSYRNRTPGTAAQ
jgi:hypothetical protein